MQVVVDRIEGNIAVLEIEGGSVIELPIKFLPKGSKEGSVLSVKFEIDFLNEKERINKMTKLQQKLNHQE